MNVDVIYVNKNRASLKCSDREVFKQIREIFSIRNPNPKPKNNSPKRFYSIAPNGSFKIGLWSSILGEIKKICPEVILDIDDRILPWLNPSISDDESIADITSLSKDGFELRDYQQLSIQRMKKYGRGIVLLATSAGKTAVIAGFLHNTNFNKIVIVVPNTILLNQTYADLVDFGVVDISKWSGKNELCDTSVIIATAQIMLSRRDELESISESIDCVIVDEVHKLCYSSKISSVIDNIPSPHRFGMTGTLPDDKLDKWNVMGIVGDVLIEEKSHGLRQSGTITDVEVHSVVLEHAEIFKDFQEEYEFLYSNRKRNGLIYRINDKFSDFNFLILVDRIEHGNNLAELFKKNGRDVYFIRGETTDEEREIAKHQMENNSGVTIIAISSIFATGVSINNLHAVVFCAIGKSKVRIVQSIGRALRKHPSKDVALIFDIADTTKYSARHYRERLKIYKSERINCKEKIIKI